ncbi:MAG: hypothetical protein KC503_47395 [Myxococcales bacterium]|nr:hypothetical protein [Myxococcales bacterium]
MKRLALTVTFVVAACALPALARAAGNPDADFASAQSAYQRGDYKRTITLLKPLLYPSIRLSSADDVLAAHKMLGISFFFEKDNAAADNEFLAILNANPSYALDPMVDPAAAIKRFEIVKKRNADKLARIAAAKRAAELARQKELARKRALSQVVIERETILHPFWVSFMPFGIGQFQNGHTTKGYVMLSLQSALGLTSIGLEVARRVRFEGGVGQNSSDRALADRMTTASYITFGLFGAAVLYGIIDALAYYTPKSTRERRYRKKIADALIAPTGAAVPGGATVGVTGVF